MRARGINYDTGFTPDGQATRTEFDPEVVRRELRVIADDLHCDAVRISGGDVDRLGLAAEAAAEAGLEVWFAPFPCQFQPDELLDVLAEFARRAEALRLGGARVVFVAGCEISLFNHGFLPGDGLFERMSVLRSADESWYRTEYPAVLRRLNRFLADVAETVRGEFGGQITYASGPWERIDWAPFDFVGVDAYRAAYNKATFRDEIREHFKHGKPVAVTEFGCCAYEGAGDRGATGWMIANRKTGRLDGDYVRDEHEQVRYLRELSAIFEDEGVDTAFWFTFAGYGLPHRPEDPRADLDLASYGVVRMLPDDVSWEPKECFRAMAELYASSSGGAGGSGHSVGGGSSGSMRGPSPG